MARAFATSSGGCWANGWNRRLGKTVDFRKPDLAIVVNPFKETVALQVNPLFVAGRYRKITRDIPQSKWFCSNCRGKGCEKCGGTGKLYPESVEEIVSKPLLEAAQGEKSAFHASGREDIDAAHARHGTTLRRRDIQAEKTES